MDKFLSLTRQTITNIAYHASLAIASADQVCTTVTGHLKKQNTTNRICILESKFVLC